MCSGHSEPSSGFITGAHGHCGMSALFVLVHLLCSSWHGVQKCVVPKQKNVATEQQNRHLYSKSVKKKKYEARHGEVP